MIRGMSLIRAGICAVLTLFPVPLAAQETLLEEIGTPGMLLEGFSPLPTPRRGTVILAPNTPPLVRPDVLAPGTIPATRPLVFELMDNRAIAPVLRPDRLQTPEIAPAEAVPVPEISAETLREVQLQRLKDAHGLSFADGRILVNGQSAEGKLDLARPEDVSALMTESMAQNVSYEDFFLSLSERSRTRLWYEGDLLDLDNLPDPGLIMQQVNPGDGQFGPGGPAICTSEACGNDLVVQPGQECPVSLCPGNPGEEGCNDEFCEVAGRADLGPGGFDPDGNGETDVTYMKEGFPEVVLLRKRVTTEAAVANCTAIVIAPGFAITALHCLRVFSTVDLSEAFSYSELSEPAGWSRITAETVNAEGFELVSDHTADVGLVTGMFVPFPPSEATPDKLGEVPFKDIALLQYVGGLDFEAGILPRLDFDPVLPDSAVSFSGFGWSDVRNNSGIDWVNMTVTEKWRELKQAAFNVVEEIATITDKPFDHLVWTHSDPRGAGGPCHFDSGGPVYRGLNRGFWYSPRRVIGVVSGLNPEEIPSTGNREQDRINHCLNPGSRVFGERLAHYKSGICALTDDKPRGCD